MDPGQIKQLVSDELAKVKADGEAVIKKVPWQKIIAWALVAIGALAIGIMAYNLLRPAPKQATAPYITSEAPKAENVPKVVMAGPKTITVYVKEKLNQKVPLPPAVMNNPNIQAVATGDIKPAPYGGTAVAYTNISTGASGVSFQAKTRPWLQFGGQTSIGVGVGLSSQGGQVGAVRIRQDVLRLWSANISAEAEANTHTTGQTDARAMVWAEYRF